MTWLNIMEFMSLCLPGVSCRGTRAVVDMKCIVGLYILCLRVTAIMIFFNLDGYLVEAKETLQMTYKGSLNISTFDINTSG